ALLLPAVLESPLLDLGYLRLHLGDPAHELAVCDLELHLLGIGLRLEDRPDAVDHGVTTGWIHGFGSDPVHDSGRGTFALVPGAKGEVTVELFHRGWDVLEHTLGLSLELGTFCVRGWWDLFAVWPDHTRPELHGGFR